MVRQNVRSERKVVREEGEVRWIKINTPLSNYTYGYFESLPNGRFDTYLLEKIKEKRKSGSTIPIKVLDIGIGMGNQWIDFLNSHNLKLGRDIEIHGSGFTRSAAHPVLKNNVKACTADNIHKKFKRNYYNVVVSHYGLHQQQEAGIEDALHVLKPGGDLILSGELSMPQVNSREGLKHYEIKHTNDTIFGWGMHLRKK